jgi:hypothetical protein
MVFKLAHKHVQVAYANPFPPAGWAPSKRQATAALAASLDPASAPEVHTAAAAAAVEQVRFLVNLCLS